MFLRHIVRYMAPLTSNRCIVGSIRLFSTPLEHDAQNGCVESMRELGRQMMDGELGASREDEAERWLNAAAEAGDVDSQFYLAVTLRRRVDRAKEHGEPESALAAASAGGRIDTDQKVTNAEDVMKIINEAKRRARTDKKNKLRALSSGAAAARDALGTVEELSEFWCRRAARGGHARAMTFMGNLLMSRTDKGDQVEGLLWYERAAKLTPPESDACYNLGLLYFEGKEGVVGKNLEASFAHFLEAARAGDLESTFWVGYCHATGEGGACLHPQRAVEYLGRAQEMGHTGANYYLAQLYRGGAMPDAAGAAEGAVELPPDASAFRKHLDLAVHVDGDADAVYCLADMHMHGLDGTNRSAIRAAELYAVAAEGGHLDATVSLGAMYYSGLGGLVRNPRKAFELYNAAAENGHTEAWRNLAAMYAAGDGVPKSQETANGIMKAIFGVGAEEKKA